MIFAHLQQGASPDCRWGGASRVGAEGSPLKGGALPRPAGGKRAPWLVTLCQGLEARLVELQKGSWGSPPQEAGDPPSERMLAFYKERNGSLRAELEAKQQLLSRSQASLAASQQERGKLQRKVGGTGGAVWGAGKGRTTSPLARCSDQGQLRGGRPGTAQRVSEAPPLLTGIPPRSHLDPPSACRWRHSSRASLAVGPLGRKPASRRALFAPLARPGACPLRSGAPLAPPGKAPPGGGGPVWGAEIRPLGPPPSQRRCCCCPPDPAGGAGAPASPILVALPKALGGGA